MAEEGQEGFHDAGLGAVEEVLTFLFQHDVREEKLVDTR
jgi:hypothetical protein